MICTDWRDSPPEAVARLYAAERERWIADLAWDPTELFATVEQGRLAGHVSGWIAHDRDRVVGWTFYILHDNVLQIGALVGERPSIVRRLLDAVMASPEALVARSLSCFVYPSGRGTASALERQRFALRESLYLTRELSPTSQAEPQTDLVRGWTSGDFAGAVRVLSGAYHGVPGAECFAADHSREQWARYTWQILRTPGCGRFDASLSRVVCAPGSQTPAAVALVTWIAPDAAHVAQIAVAPELRRQGLGRVLMEAVLAGCAHAGATTLTLMVDGANAPAIALYEGLEFTRRSGMLYGSRAARSRVAA
ncbi:MAG: GNAT family N-acetyltransferase [Vicinamibacterales bacterium]